MGNKLKIHWNIIGWLTVILVMLFIAGAVEKLL